MLFKYLTIAAACLCGGPAGAVSWGTAVDNGIVLAPSGIVPNAGQGAAPFWGGNTVVDLVTSQITDYRIATAVDNNLGSAHDVLPYLNGTGLLPSTYLYGGTTSTQLDISGSVNIDIAGYVGGTCGGGHCVDGPTHAALWTNAGTSFADLHPSGFVASLAQAVDQYTDVVGWATDNGGLLHAMVLFGPHVGGGRELPRPTGFTQAAATAIANSGESQASSRIGGYGTAANGQTHPIVWVSNGAGGYTATDVLPGNGVSGVIVAGDPLQFAINKKTNAFGGSMITASTGGQYHAAIWYGPNWSDVVDLHPAKGNFTSSSVYAERVLTDYTVEAGLAAKSKGRNTVWSAMVWRGTAGSAVNLGKKLPAGFSQSTATGIDNIGNIVGAALDASGVWHVVTWPIE
ncbi:MAG TPA: hypothetical protein VMB71_01250 [Acetobacteraceae bacterium]|nr:hypothetical protein [Acetobacteraceae bacterium]